MTDSFFSIDVSADLETLLNTFKDSPDKVDKAVRRAIKKLSRYVERQVLREISRHHPLSQRQLKKLRRLRIRVFNPNSAVNDYALSVYIGTNPVTAHHYGNPSPQAKGVKTGRKFWQGAFVVSANNSDKQLVFKRTKHWEHKYVRSRRSGRWMWMGLPIKLQKNNSFHDDVESALNALLPDVQQRFTTLIQQELNYAFNIE